MDMQEEIIQQGLRVVGTQNKDAVKSFLNKDDNIGLINQHFQPTGFTLLQLAASNNIDVIRTLLELGADVKITDDLGRNVLQYLIDARKITAETGYLLIKAGVNPNTKGLDYPKNFLQIILDRAADNIIQEYVPLLLRAGASLVLSEKEASTGLVALIDGEVSEDRLCSALAMVMAGANPALKNSKNKNLLEVMYELYPEIKVFIKNEGLSIQEMSNPVAFFKKIDIPTLAFEIKCENKIHKARNKFMNLLLD